MTVEELNSTKELVEFVLDKYPETRHSDTMLYLQCGKLLGAKNINDLERLNLNIISIHKARQVIQNKENKFLPTEDVLKIRQQRAKSVKDYMGRLNN